MRATSPLATTPSHDVSDRAGRAATQLVVSRLIDNQPPVVTLLPVRNQAGAMIDGYVNEATATLRGTVTAGGSPTTVAVTVTPGGTAMVTPDAAGNWSHTTGALAEGSYAVSATASDEAGNAAVAPAAGAFVVDRTGPTLSWDASSVRDELDCNATQFAATAANGAYVPGPDPPIGYRCDQATVRDLVNTTNPRVGKFTTRLTSTAAADNPIRFRPRATEGAGGVGLAAAASTIQVRIYRVGQPPPASWRDTVEVVDTGSTTVQASAYALATDWPELATHTARFVIEVRATDRLGNPSAATVTRTWDHHPLAPPVQVNYVGPAPTTSSDPLYPHSIYAHALVPAAAQSGPGTAMSGVMDNLAPRGLLEYRLLNHADQPVTVGFFVPVPSTWSYVRRLWEKSPPANTAISPPSSGSLCGWPSASFRARSDDTTSPYSCTVSNCTCPGPSWSVPVDSTPGPTTSPFPVPSPTNPQTGALAPVLVRAFDADTGTMDELPWVGLQSTISVGATTYAFFEVTVPARPGPSKARYVRVLVSLRNLDLFAPHTVFAENVHNELSGMLPLENLGVAITGRFLERWVECNDFDPDNGSCTGLLLRRRVRALVEARLDVPADTGRLSIRTRAFASVTSSPEVLPGLDELRNSATVRWHTCENASFTPGGTCTPSIP